MHYMHIHWSFDEFTARAIQWANKVLYSDHCILKESHRIQKYSVNNQIKITYSGHISNYYLKGSTSVSTYVIAGYIDGGQV